MGSPYLKSGEGIVLTTTRVSVGAVPYDVMLTTRRIFLIDAQSPRFDPGILPLDTLLSVRSGMTPANDPVIILLFRTQEGTGKQQPVNLVFSQTKNENRSAERDDWVRNLIQLSVPHDERETPAEAPAVPEVTRVIGLRPTARHGVAPEKVRPLSNVSSRQSELPPVTVIPDEGENDREIPVPAAVVSVPVSGERNATDTGIAEPSTGHIPVRGLAPAIAAAPLARVIIPQIIEELLPVKKTAVLPDRQEPVPAAGIDPEALFRAIPATSRFMTVTEERAPQPPGSPETAPGPEPAQHRVNIPVPETIPVPDAGVPAPVAAEQEDVPEIIRALRIGATEPVPEPADAGEPVPEPAPEIIRALHTGATEPDATEPASAFESVPENPEADFHAIPESHVTVSIPENAVQQSAGRHAPEAVFRREPATTEAPPVRHPIPPAHEIRPIRTTLAYAAVLLLVIALVAAGAMLLLPQGPGPTDNPVSPTPTEIVQAATSPPGTVQPTTIPPATTRIVTPVPSLPASAVPQTGVWVQVSSPSNYFGSIGNPDTMQKVSGTGNNVYKVLRSDRPVQVSVQKNDNSGALLFVGIYRNGTLISTRSITSPRGTIDLLIDPQTARAPGLTEEDTLPEHAATPSGIQTY